MQAGILLQHVEDCEKFGRAGENVCGSTDLLEPSSPYSVITSISIF